MLPACGYEGMVSEAISGVRVELEAKNSALRSRKPLYFMLLHLHFNKEGKIFATKYH